MFRRVFTVEYLTLLLKPASKPHVTVQRILAPLPHIVMSVYLHAVLC